MAAAAQYTQNRRDVVEFPANVPVTVSLAYSKPRMVSTQYGERAMFTTTDNRVLFLAPPVAGKITELGINVRVPFTITRNVSATKGQPDTWEVARIPGEQADGTFVALNGGSANEAHPKPMQRATAAGSGLLVEEANQIVGAYATVLERALTTYQGRIKPDEVRSILLSAYIQTRGRVA